MKRILAVAALGAGLACGGAAYAQVDAANAEGLAKDMGCLSCHRVASKKTGPSFKSASADLKKQGLDADKAVANIKANKEHADDKKDWKDGDLKTVASWILSL